MQEKLRSVLTTMVIGTTLLAGTAQADQTANAQGFSVEIGPFGGMDISVLSDTGNTVQLAFSPVDAVAGILEGASLSSGGSYEPLPVIVNESIWSNL